MKSLHTLVISIFFAYCLDAQAVTHLDITLAQNPLNAGKLDVRVRPDGSFNGIYSAIVFTIRWSSIYGVSLTDITQPSPYNSIISIQKQGVETISGGYVYQKFAGFGFSSMQSFGENWSPNTEYTILTISHTGNGVGLGLFEIVNDAWTTANNGKFYQELASLDKTGTIYGSGGTIPLPVTSISFEAIPKENSIYLKWNCSIDIDFGEYYILERTEEENNEYDYKEIARLAPKGDDLILPDVSFIDHDVLPNVNYYYRLKVMAQDGSLLSSRISHAEISSIEKQLFELFPNPANELLIVQLKKEVVDGNLLIFSSNGALVKKENIKKGVHQYKIDISDLFSGSYTLKLDGNDSYFSESQKFVIVR